jgi:polysaccharide export outer membrane protein
VFRVIDGHRTGAVFDLNSIRAGREPDPELIGGDVVVVGFSSVKGAFRDFLTAAPLLSVFRPF